MARVLSVLVALVTIPIGAQSGAAADAELRVHLARIGARVQEYFDRFHSLVCRESVELQPLRPDLSRDGRARDLVYELRVEWTPSSDGMESGAATIHRDLLTVNGRPPRPEDKASCLDPKPASPEPLAMLLPHRQAEFEFTIDDIDRIDGRNAVVLEYRSLSKEPPVATWHDECVTVDVLSLTRGRIWADAETGEVLRLDESLTGFYEFPVPMALQRRGGPPSMMVERSDTTIRYRPFSFTDPEESLVLPARIETLTTVRGSQVPWQRMVQTFSEYRRFLTSGRIIP
ncbi:MAG: hypothetical protein AB7P22_02240 [Vicinamibacterales bacterium]